MGGPNRGGLPPAAKNIRLRTLAHWGKERVTGRACERSPRRGRGVLGPRIHPPPPHLACGGHGSPGKDCGRRQECSLTLPRLQQGDKLQGLGL